MPLLHAPLAYHCVLDQAEEIHARDTIVFIYSRPKYIIDEIHHLHSTALCFLGPPARTDLKAERLNRA